MWCVWDTHGAHWTLNVCDRHYRRRHCRRLQAIAGETAGQFRDCPSVADILKWSNLLEITGPFQDPENVPGNLEIIGIAKLPATLTPYRPTGLKSPSVAIFHCVGSSRFGVMFLVWSAMDSWRLYCTLLRSVGPPVVQRRLLRSAQLSYAVACGFQADPQLSATQRIHTLDTPTAYLFHFFKNIT